MSRSVSQFPEMDVDIRFTKKQKHFTKRISKSVS